VFPPPETDGSDNTWQRPERLWNGENAVNRAASRGHGTGHGTDTGQSHIARQDNVAGQGHVVGQDNVAGRDRVGGRTSLPTGRVLGHTGADADRRWTGGIARLRRHRDRRYTTPGEHLSAAYAVV